MKTANDIMKKLEEIAREVQDCEPNRMNAMLAPKPHEFDEATMTIKIRYEAKEWEKNHRGEIHGGAVAAMFDTAMGMSVLAFSDSYAVATADLDVSYIRPFMGEAFIFEVNVIHPGRRLTRVRALAKDEMTGKILASATSNFVHSDK